MKQSFDDEESFEDGQYPSSNSDQVRSMLMGLSEMGKIWTHPPRFFFFFFSNETPLKVYSAFCLFPHLIPACASHFFRIFVCCIWLSCTLNYMYACRT
jgi:hypothetical protein